MYIYPNSTLLLCKDIPFNNNYEQTLWFDDIIAQFDYFRSKSYKSYEKLSYIRPTSDSNGYIDVKELADNLYATNYLCFQNTAYGSKWFYAFVTDVIYINNKTTRIFFELDVLQTWMFDYSLNPCFVEREHVANDVIGGHIVDEGLELGEYVYKDFGTVKGFDSDYAIVVVSSFESVTATSDGYERVIGQGGIYGGVYSALQYKVFYDADSLNSWLLTVTEANYSEGIMSIFMIPKDFLVEKGTKEPKTVTQTYQKKDWQTPFEYKLGDTVTEIIPKNNKLYSYPYNVLCITDQNGNIANYRCEYFASPTMSFDVTVAMSGSPEAQIVPKDYKNIDGPNYMERMTMANFPMCAYTTDAYRAYVAQNAIPSMVYQGAGEVVQGVSGAAKTGLNRIQQWGQDNAQSELGQVAWGLGNLIESGTNVLSNLWHSGSKAVKGAGIAAAYATQPEIANLISQQYQASTLPPQAHGSQTSIINMATGTQGFRCYRAHIHPTYIKIIDDYFTKYGYAIRRVKTPNTHVRQYWTYTKTVGCTITGSLPADDERIITQIYDKGITFFTNEEAIKKQNSLDNPTLLSLQSEVS